MQTCLSVGIDNEKIIERDRHMKSWICGVAFRIKKRYFKEANAFYPDITPLQWWSHCGLHRTPRVRKKIAKILHYTYFFQKILYWRWKVVYILVWYQKVYNKTNEMPLVGAYFRNGKGPFHFTRGLINCIDTKAKCCHLKKLTCKETLRQVFIRVSRLEIQSVMSVFFNQFCELLPLKPSLWFISPPFRPLLNKYLYCIHVYSV